jgi:predicted O-linked N-acetylglucosamine transferase (SPINDLY family)
MSATDFHTALDHHRAGRLREAETAYLSILARDPDHVEAIHGLGALALQTGRSAEALPLLSRSAALRPASMPYASNLGMAYLALKRYPEAEAEFRRAIDLAPGEAAPHFNLANALKEQRRLADAVASYLKAIELQPDHAVAYNNLGNCYRELGRLEEAREALTRAVRLRPTFAEAHLNLGSVLTTVGRPGEGEACCREAARLQPQWSEPWINLGTALFAQDRNEEAIEAFRRAAQVDPSRAEAHENLGLALVALSRLTEAVDAFRAATAAAPDRATSWSHLISTLTAQRRFVEADACYQRVERLLLDDPRALSRWLYDRLYHPDATLRSIAESHARWNARHGTPDLPGASSRCVDVAKEVQDVPSGAAGGRSPAGREPIAGRPMRVGFVSGDFGQHPVGSFTIRTLEALPPLGIEVLCYSTHPRQGPLNDRFRRCAAVWREVGSMSDADLAASIAADRVDVLIDLAGHSAENRLGVFARRPAPVQATWVANEGTTGLTAMDYLIADEKIVPRSAEPYYCERVVRLPTYVSWEPPAAAPPVAPPPSASGVPVTFGSFNNPAKYHAGVAELWSRVLHRLPGSRLLLQYRHLLDQTVQSDLIGLFAAHGIGNDRLEFRGWQPYHQMLDSYRQIDVALDPFPFGGGVTTCEALWMGVPVVTLPGETFAGRHSCSYLHTIGIPELVADSDREFVEIAVSFAQDPARLSALRTSMRERVLTSPLCDGRGCAQALATALCQMCSGRRARV